jgi:NADPH-dependent 2,4-dienoyl-CoA reductase/sulfur reductase-like enzyme
VLGSSFDALHSSNANTSKLIHHNILVIGAGPAALEFTRVARFKGHCVTVWEKNVKPGGQLY